MSVRSEELDAAIKEARQALRSLEALRDNPKKTVGNVRAIMTLFNKVVGRLSRISTGRYINGDD